MPLVQGMVLANSGSRSFTPQPAMQPVASIAQVSPAPPAPSPPATRNIVDEIQKLASLRASGVLTEQQFEAAKMQVLSVGA